MKRTNLKIARIKKDFSQKILAQKIGTSTQAISEYERGTMNPSYENMKKISEVLDSSVDELFFRD